jgi:hypothetical protein
VPHVAESRGAPSNNPPFRLGRVSELGSTSAWAPFGCVLVRSLCGGGEGWTRRGMEAVCRSSR